MSLKSYILLFFAFVTVKRCWAIVIDYSSIVILCRFSVRERHNIRQSRSIAVIRVEHDDEKSI